MITKFSLFFRYPDMFVEKQCAKCYSSNNVLGCRTEDGISQTESCSQLVYFVQVLRMTDQYDTASNDQTCKYEDSLQELTNGCGCFANVLTPGPE